MLKYLGMHGFGLCQNCVCGDASCLTAVVVVSFQVLEKARTGKLLGAALEAKVRLHVGDGGLRARLAALDDAPNGADPLRYTFITSKVSPSPSYQSQF